MPAPVDIQILDTSHADEVMDLLEYSFGWPHTERNHTRLTHLMEHAQSYGARLDGALAGQVFSLPFTAGLHGAHLPACGIGFVATYPEYRGRGVASAVMDRILADAHADGVALSYLAPFSYPFYRAFGYEHAFDERTYQMRVGDWPDGPRVAGHVERLEWQRARDAVHAIYAAGEAHRPAALVRDAWWEEYKFNLRAAYRFAVYYAEDGEPQGYLAYQLGNNAVNIFEWEWLTTEAYHALSRYIRSHQAEFALAWSCAVPNVGERMPLPADPATISYATRPYMMARIVDMQAFLGAFPFAGTQDFAFSVHVGADAHAPWNEGVWTVERRDGSVSVTHAAGEPGPSASVPVLRTTIQRAVQLFLGYAPLSQLTLTGGIQAEDPRLQTLLAQIIPAGKPAMEDYF